MGQGTCEEIEEKMEDDSGDEDDWMGLPLLWESWGEIGGFSVDWGWRWVKDAAKLLGFCPDFLTLFIVYFFLKRKVKVLP